MKQQSQAKLLSVQNLQAWYHPKKMVLTDLSLDIRTHEAIGLIGLNGAGKTTFLNVLSGLHDRFKADELQLNSLFRAGQIQAGGRFRSKSQTGSRSSAFREAAFKLHRYTVFAEDHSFQYFTFREYLSYVFAAYQKELPDTSALIRGFHFEEYTDILFRDLSMGNQKKAFLITAFALRPDLLLLDEPVNGLDFTSTEFLYQLIAGYPAYGTVLFSSHILESITLTCDRVLVLENGKIRQSFEQDEINAAQIREALHDEEHL